MKSTRTQQNRSHSKRPYLVSQRLNKKRRGLPFMIVFLYVALLMEFAAAVLTTPILGLSGIVITGIGIMPAGEQETLKNSLILKPGSSLLLMPEAQLKRALIALPAVQSARIVRKWPHTLVVDVTARQTYCCVNFLSAAYEFSVDGIPIRPLRPFLKGRLPLIVVNQNTPTQLGVRTANDSLNVALNILSDSEIRGNSIIRKIDVDQSGNICLNMPSRMKFYIGQPDEVATKMESFRRLARNSPNLAFRYSSVNLTSPANPAGIPLIPVAVDSNPIGKAKQPAVTTKWKPIWKATGKYPPAQ